MKEKIAILKSEVAANYKRIKRLFDKFDKAYKGYLTSKEYSKLVESAFYVSQTYSGFENIFQSIARTFENSVEQDFWHKSILERMSLDIEDIRPALISEGSFKCLNELRAFRHFFRHAYDSDIDRDKFKIIAKNVVNLRNLFEKDLKHFLKFLDSLLT